MLHTMFHGNGPAGSGHGGHLGHVTSIIPTIFISMYLKAYIQNVIKNGLVVSEKKHV